MLYIIDSHIQTTKIYYRRNMVMNVLIAMLEELLKKDNAENKKRKLQSEFGIEMSVETTRRVNVMCNLSEVMLEYGEERGIAIGEERGIAIGEKRGIELVAENMIRAKKSDGEIQLLTGLDLSRINELKKNLK